MTSGPSFDELGAVCRVGESGIGRDEHGIDTLGQLDVEGVDQTECVATIPGADQEAGQGMALDCGRRNDVEPFGHLAVGELAGAVKTAERRKHLRVEMRRDVELAASQPELDFGSQVRS